MLDAMYISAIGLEAQKERLDAMANNLANVGTVAFKRQSVDFSALLDRAPRSAQSEPVGVDSTRALRSLRFDVSPGEIHATGRALDIGIAGDGFIEVALPGARTGYTRVGALQVDREGQLSLPTGQVLKSDIRIPNDARNLEVLPDGQVIGVIGADIEPTVFGQIELAMFANPEALDYRGEGIFVAPENMEPMRVRPGEEGSEELAVRSLEGANVRMTDEMVSMLMMQRAYELNSRIVQLADELMGMSNNLRRS